MRIEPVEKEAARPEVVRVYEALQRAEGNVPTFHKMLAHRPEILRAFTQLSGALWAGGALSEKLKDLAYLRASILNGCEY